jgi:hypothetical protein
LQQNLLGPVAWRCRAATLEIAGIEFIDQNRGGAGIRLRKQKKGLVDR